MNSILITGCNRGLGLGLVNKLVGNAKSPKYLIATCRNKLKAEELTNIAKKHSNVVILEIDLNKVECYDNFFQKVKDIVGDGGLNVLFNNAGIAGKFTRLGLVKPEILAETFYTNTVAPIMLTKTFLPLLKQSAKNNSDGSMGISKAVIINMSSILGSLAENNDGGYYPYRCSKVALNMATRSMSADLKGDGIMAVSIHPGWVKTDMGGSKAPLDVETSVSDIVNLMFKLNETHNGKFLAHDGTELKW